MLVSYQNLNIISTKIKMPYQNILTTTFLVSLGMLPKFVPEGLSDNKSVLFRGYDSFHDA